MGNDSNASGFTHLDAGGQPQMVDVGAKAETLRTAVAESRVHLPPVILQQFTGQDLVTKKGSVFQTAIIAGIMAAKKTPELIPLCHTLLLDNCKVDIQLQEEEVVYGGAGEYVTTGYSAVRSPGKARRDKRCSSQIPAAPRAAP